MGAIMEHIVVYRCNGALMYFVLYCPIVADRAGGSSLRRERLPFVTLCCFPDTFTLKRLSLALDILQ